MKKAKPPNGTAIILYRKLTKFAGKYLNKGSSVYIEGRIKTRKWQDKDSQDRCTTEIETVLANDNFDDDTPFIAARIRAERSTMSSVTIQPPLPESAHE